MTTANDFEDQNAFNTLLVLQKEFYALLWDEKSY